MKYQVSDEGFFGKFGGAYVPEILYRCVDDLRLAYREILDSPDFQREYRALLRDYVGRPSPLYHARRMSELYGCQLYLKREDLNHTGAHKINNTVGQILMAKRMGKTRVTAETGAGQHGVATATVCALMGMRCEIFMGKTDVERQHANVERMRMLGATVHAVTTGNMTLSDACSEAIRDWCRHPRDTFYLVGSTMGPHPYPDIVARLQSVISEELKGQLAEKVGRDYPDYLIACVGGGSNAAGTIYHYIDDERVKIYLAEAAGQGVDTPYTAATMHCGTEGIIHGARTLVMQTDDGQHQRGAGLSWHRPHARLPGPAGAHPRLGHQRPRGHQGGLRADPHGRHHPRHRERPRRGHARQAQFPSPGRGGAHRERPRRQGRGDLS